MKLVLKVAIATLIQTSVAISGHSSVMVHFYYAPFKCPPCEVQKKDIPLIHKKFPEMWVGISNGVDEITEIHQLDQNPVKYRFRPFKPSAYPFCIIYQTVEVRGKRKTKIIDRISGWSKKDLKRLEAAIERASR